MNDGYTVRTINGCKVITGEVPLGDMTAILKMMPDDAVLDTRAAKHLGAVLVGGRPEDTKKLLDLPACDAIRAEVQLAKISGLSDAAQKWLLSGERGSSSETMFAIFSGKEIKRLAYPHDPDDLKRCRLLLEQVPEFAPRIGEMAAISPEWARLVSRWDELCATMDAECPDWHNGKWSAKNTYAMMKECIETASI